MLDKPVKIEWAGESINTKHYLEITEERRKAIEDEWYREHKPCRMHREIARQF